MWERLNCEWDRDSFLTVGAGYSWGILFVMEESEIPPVLPS